MPGEHSLLLSFPILDGEVMVRAIIGFFWLVLSLSISEAQEGARLALLTGNQGYSTKVGRLKNPTMTSV